MKSVDYKSIQSDGNWFTTLAEDFNPSSLLFYDLIFNWIKVFVSYLLIIFFTHKTVSNNKEEIVINKPLLWLFTAKALLSRWWQLPHPIEHFSRRLSILLLVLKLRYYYRQRWSIFIVRNHYELLFCRFIYFFEHIFHYKLLFWLLWNEIELIRIG